MKLTDLNPRWFAEDGRRGQGVIFDCPHCIAGGKIARSNGDVVRNAARLAVAFSPTLDGGAAFPIKKIETLFEAFERTEESGDGGAFNVVPPGVIWQRTGDAFDVLTFAPSVDASASGHWHGHVQNGEIR